MPRCLCWKRWGSDPRAMSGDSSWIPWPVSSLQCGQRWWLRRRIQSGFHRKILYINVLLKIRQKVRNLVKNCQKFDDSKNPTADSRNPTADSQNQRADSQNPTADTQRSNSWQPKSSSWLPQKLTSDSPNQTADSQNQIYNSQKLTSDNQKNNNIRQKNYWQPKNNIWQKTTSDNKKPSSDKKTTSELTSALWNWKKRFLNSSLDQSFFL